MINKKHPDVQLFREQQKYVLRLIPIETPRFPYGLSLGYEFDDKAQAEKKAEQVQKYLDSWAKSVKM
jgi:hypothetical protein